MTMYAADTFGEKIELPSAVGQYEVSINLLDLRLGSGKYLVNIGAGTSDGRALSSRSGAASFDTPNKLAGAGLVRANPEFRVQPA